jgi:hypothetical protein
MTAHPLLPKRAPPIRPDVSARSGARFFKPPPGDERSQLAESCHLIDLGLDELVAHHPADAGVANWGELLGGLLERPHDPALWRLAHDRIRVPTRRLGHDAGSLTDLRGVGAEHRSGHDRERDRLAPGALAGLVDAGFALLDLFERRKRRVVLVGETGR